MSLTEKEKEKIFEEEKLRKEIRDKLDKDKKKESSIIDDASIIYFILWVAVIYFFIYPKFS